MVAKVGRDATANPVVKKNLYREEVVRQRMAEFIG
jgi:hypothetical protein